MTNDELFREILGWGLSALTAAGLLWLVCRYLAAAFRFAVAVPCYFRHWWAKKDEEEKWKAYYALCDEGEGKGFMKPLKDKDKKGGGRRPAYRSESEWVEYTDRITAAHAAAVGASADRVWYADRTWQ